MIQVVHNMSENERWDHPDRCHLVVDIGVSSRTFLQGGWIMT